MFIAAGAVKGEDQRRARGRRRLGPRGVGGLVALFGAEIELPLSLLASGGDFGFGSSEGRAAIHDSNADL
ncbi:hypothetical protein, partial [Pseudodonghicola xiamenensis]|uniref:hypothetical protein n=1 Tax=Pseudodonghicola xiamenensis TaxID=337702 RepID=UPI001E2EA5B7